MTVTNVQKDAKKRTLTLTAGFDATTDRIWQLWADPRQLERWWGPPTYPATFDSHDLRPGGLVKYHMTGPTGDTPHGLWEVTKVDPPRSLEFRDLFAGEDGNPDPSFPTTNARVNIDDIGSGRTRMTIHSAFPSVAAMEQLVGMGMVEGLTDAVGQIDAILAE